MILGVLAVAIAAKHVLHAVVHFGHVVMVILVVVVLILVTMSAITTTKVELC